MVRFIGFELDFLHLCLFPVVKILLLKCQITNQFYGVSPSFLRVYALCHKWFVKKFKNRKKNQNLLFFSEFSLLCKFRGGFQGIENWFVVQVHTYLTCLFLKEIGPFDFVLHFRLQNSKYFSSNLNLLKLVRKSAKIRANLPLVFCKSR